MNCLEFESQVGILARGTLADARTRAAAEAHGESCAACAARLDDERALSVGLRALAAGMKTAEAPARVEASLVAAFRARAAASVSEGLSDTAAASNVVPMSGHVPARHWSWAKTIAVASMAAAASLALFVLVRPDAPQHTPARRAMLEPPPSTSVGGPPAIARGNSSQAVEEVVASAPAPAEVRSVTPRTVYTQRTRAANVSYDRGTVSRRARAADARAQEVATDFIPLVQVGPYTQAEEGHLVRVELPRAALASFGLPVNVEAPGGRVKADVLMGQDGIARAIRFVR
ncbi:MAG TPA: hypothetical protein VN282_07395 [Pyrinomonadaceae bacterium]|nr:hypothetical protein [Pyrinomonadaceae bacterium]